MWRILGGLGSHDLSAMREALGMPNKVLGANLGYPFWKWVNIETLADIVSSNNHKSIVCFSNIPALR